MSRKIATNVDVEGTRSPRQTLLYDVTLRLAAVQVAHGADNIKRMRRELPELDRSVAVLQRYLEDQPMPETGELVCGTVVVDRHNETEWIRLYGKVISSDELGNVRVQFDHFEFHDMSDEDFEPEARSYLGREIAIHAVDMEWQTDVGEWNFDL